MSHCLVVNCRRPDCGTAWAALQPRKRIEHTVGCPSKPLMDPAGTATTRPEAPPGILGHPADARRADRTTAVGVMLETAKASFRLVRFPAPWVATLWLMANGARILNGPWFPWFPSCMPSIICQGVRRDGTRHCQLLRSLFHYRSMDEDRLWNTNTQSTAGRARHERAARSHSLLTAEPP